MENDQNISEEFTRLLESSRRQENESDTELLPDQIGIDHFQEAIDITDTNSKKEKLKRTHPVSLSSDDEDFENDSETNFDWPTRKKIKLNNSDHQEKSEIEDMEPEQPQFLNSHESETNQQFETKPVVEFNMDIFYRRLLIRFLKDDKLIGKELTAMGVDFEQADRAMIDYFQNMIITIENKNISLESEKKNCLLGLELFKTLTNLISSEDNSEILAEVEVIEQTIKNYDYNLAIIHEVSTMPRDQLLKSRPKPFKQLSMYATQTLIGFVIKKIPILIKVLIEKYKKHTQ